MASKFVGLSQQRLKEKRKKGLEFPILLGLKGQRMEYTFYKNWEQMF